MNETIKTQLNHRTIRAFKNQELTDEQKKTLEEVARHTSTSMFLQQFSMMHVTDDEKRAKIREITGQKYVGANGNLFIFVADLYRNSEIRRQLGKDEGALHGTDVFLQAVEDTVLAVQNFVNAAESMGLGAVILGSINNEPKELVKILNLPKMTYPVLGVQVGVPDQEPQLKPRLPLEFILFENEYPHDFSISPHMMKSFKLITIFATPTSALIRSPIRSDLPNLTTARRIAAKSLKYCMSRDFAGNRIFQSVP